MFKIGDIVILTSGGPPMTVIALVGHPKAQEVLCAWLQTVGKSPGIPCNRSPKATPIYARSYAFAPAPGRRIAPSSGSDLHIRLKRLLEQMESGQ